MKGFVLTLIAVLLGTLVMAGMINGCGSGLIEEVVSMPIEPEDNMSTIKKVIIAEITKELSEPESVVRSKHEPDAPKVESAEEEQEETEGQTLQPVDSEIPDDVNNGDTGTEEPLDEVAEESDDSSRTYYGSCRVTFYCPCSQCCGSWGNSTASGVMPTAGWTVANGSLPFGTLVEIEGHTYCVEDRGVGGDQFDIFVNDHQEALNRGLYYADVYLIG